MAQQGSVFAELSVEKGSVALALVFEDVVLVVAVDGEVMAAHRRVEANNSVPLIPSHRKLRIREASIPGLWKRLG